MADYVLMFPELSIVQDAVILLLIFIMSYEWNMLDLDDRQNERKHLVKIAILFAIVIRIMFI